MLGELVGSERNGEWSLVRGDCIVCTWENQ